MNICPWIIFDFAGTLVLMRPPKLLANKPALYKLSSKYQLGIITGASRSETQNILRKLKLVSLFKMVITADDSAYRKPNPKLFFITPKIYIGDAKKDELMAKYANIRFIRVNRNDNINQIIKSLLE